MSPELNDLLKNAGPRAVAPVSLDEVVARARRWRVQRFASFAAGLAIVVTSAVAAWAMLDPLQPETEHLSPGAEACGADERQVMVFLKDDITQAELQDLQDDLVDREEVAEAAYSSKDAAYEEFKEFHIDEPQYWENLPKDALPAYVRITLKNALSAEQRAQLIDDLGRYRGVDDIQDSSSRFCSDPERENEERLVTVPDLVGRSLQRACEAAVGRNLRLRVEGGRRHCEENAAITSQDPPPGTEIELGSEVVVFVSPSKNIAAAGRGVLDKLYMELRLNAETVQAGSGVGSFLIVENRTQNPFTDPGCYLASPRFGIVDELDAELWQAIVVDCGAKYTIQPGERERLQGLVFRATTRFGEPLEPGQYLAVAQFEAHSERLVVEVTVVE